MLFSETTECRVDGNAVTTGLLGAVGFGKTTLARMACQYRRVLRRFSGGVYPVTVGRDTAGPGLAALISDVIRRAGGDGPAFSSPEQAGLTLASVLAGRGRTLLVVDDAGRRRSASRSSSERSAGNIRGARLEDPAA